MAAARLCNRLSIAAAVVLLATAPLAASAHGGGHGGGHAGGLGGHGGHGGAVGASHGGFTSGGHVVNGPGGFHPHGFSPGFHHGHWVHGVHGGTLGWWWVGGAAAVPLYVQPVAPAAVLVQPQARYYCGALQAYYPEVLTCPEPWVLEGPMPGMVPQ